MSSTQQHRILRQVLQLEGCNRASAQPLGEALQGLYLSRLLPVIEAACDALAAPGELLRIDKLELDLGALPWAHAAELPATAAERLATALPSRLAQAAQATPAHQSAAELLGHFACTGTLPWWADPTDRQALAKAFDLLLAAPAAGCAAWPAGAMPGAGCCRPWATGRPRAVSARPPALTPVWMPGWINCCGACTPIGQRWLAHAWPVWQQPCRLPAGRPALPPTRLPLPPAGRRLRPWRRTTRRSTQPQAPTLSPWRGCA